MNDIDDPIWKKVLGCVALPLILPLAFVLIPILNVLGLNKSRAGPEDLIEALQRFIDGTEGRWDLDDFSSVPYANEALEDLRQRACSHLPPLDDADRSALMRLLEEARAIQSNSG